MEGAHHHGGTILDAASRVGKRRPEQLRTGGSCTDRESRHCEHSEAIHFNTASFLLLAVFVPYAVRHLGLSAADVGLTLGMYGVGMVVGALAATRVMQRLAFGTVIGLGPVTGFVAAAVMALTTIAPMPWLAGLSFFLLGAGPSCG
jgi:Arabinose efflux permease